MRRNSTTLYTAPNGYVYDYKEPPIDTIINEDGSREEVTRHLYVNRLMISAKDSIKKYILVKDPHTEE